MATYCYVHLVSAVLPPADHTNLTSMFKVELWAGADGAGRMAIDR